MSFLHCVGPPSYPITVTWASTPPASHGLQDILDPQTLWQIPHFDRLTHDQEGRCFAASFGVANTSMTVTISERGMFCDCRNARQQTFACRVSNATDKHDMNVAADQYSISCGWQVAWRDIMAVITTDLLVSITCAFMSELWT